MFTLDYMPTLIKVDIKNVTLPRSKPALKSRGHTFGSSKTLHSNNSSLFVKQISMHKDCKPAQIIYWIFSALLWSRSEELQAYSVINLDLSHCLPLLIFEPRVHIFKLNHSCMCLLSSVRVCVCVFIYKRLFVLRELSSAKLQTNLARGGTDKCNRVWMLLNVMIFTDLAFIPLSILMSSGNRMLACPHMRGLCWVTGITRSQQHLVQHWFDEAYIIHAFPFTSTLFRGSTLRVTGPSLFFKLYNSTKESLAYIQTRTSDISSPCLNDLSVGCDRATDCIALPST